jgi:hypothetical protein
MNTMEVKILAKKLKKTINHLKSDGNTHQNTSAFFIANNWLQLGWRPPCEVSKNLVVPVAFTLGMESSGLCNCSSANL